MTPQYNVTSYEQLRCFDSFDAAVLVVGCQYNFAEDWLIRLFTTHSFSNSSVGKLVKSTLSDLALAFYQYYFQILIIGIKIRTDFMLSSG